MLRFRKLLAPSGTSLTLSLSCAKEKCAVGVAASERRSLAGSRQNRSKHLPIRQSNIAHATASARKMLTGCVTLDVSWLRTMRLEELYSITWTTKQKTVRR